MVRNPDIDDLGPVLRRLSHVSKLLRDVVISGSTGEGYSSELIHEVVGKIHFLKGFWAESFNSLLAVGWEQPSGPCPVSLSGRTACFLKVNKPKPRGRAREKVLAR